MDFKKLRAPFSGAQLEWRIGRSGLKKDGKPWAAVLAYVDARAIMTRLDDVIGPENWRDEYRQIEGGMECTIFIKIGDEWVGKVDGSQETDIEGFKGSFSKSFVRAAVKWGMGRYLYDLGNLFAVIVEKGTPGANFARSKDKKTNKDYFFYWLPPQPKAGK